MKKYHDLSKLNWKLSGWTPYIWRMNQTAEIGDTPSSEIPAVPAKVPGSVQESLKQAGIIPDWNIGTNWLKCEWVENRTWLYEADVYKRQLYNRETGIPSAFIASMYSSLLIPPNSFSSYMNTIAWYA